MEVEEEFKIEENFDNESGDPLSHREQPDKSRNKDSDFEGENPIEKTIDVWWRKEITQKELVYRSEVGKALEKLISDWIYLVDDESLKHSEHKYTNESLL